MANKKMADDKNREEYWNKDYVDYWKRRVDEANDNSTSDSKIIAGDVKTSTDDISVNTISLLNINRDDDVLEIGCGFGRNLPMLCQVSHHVSASDISAPMIEMAKSNVKEKNISFYVAPSENLPFENDSFDVVVCFAAFDAMYQSEALVEMNRVCKVGGKVLITGKNDHYYDDDDLAISAEMGARKKKHPNYFTDVKKLVESISVFGFSIDTERYYSRRGDFGCKEPEPVMPDKFYEYCFILTKTSHISASVDINISCDISKTYLGKMKV